MLQSVVFKDEVFRMYQGKIPLRDFIEQFFTFLVPIHDRQNQNPVMKWRSEIALKHNFQSYRQQQAQACQTENAGMIVQDFLRQYQEDSTSVQNRSIAQWHLAAYLEAPLYQAVGDRFRAYRDYQAPDKTWDQYLHIAKSLASDSDKVAEIYGRYKPEKDTLNQHFRLELASKIRDVFHRETGQGKYSLWYALKRVSERELRRRLIASGIDQTKTAAYIAVRDALFDVYSKSGDRWLEPNPAQYHQALEYFNRHYATVVFSGHCLKPESFRQMLTTCIKANQMLPSIESLDDERHSLVQENMLLDSPLTQLEEEQSTQDFKTRLEQIDRMLSENLQQLEEKDRAILQFSAQGLNQTQIAAKVGINQGTVSRRYQRSQRQLLTAIAQWLQSQYHISLSTLEHLAAYIELWLSRQYVNETIEEPN
jgi:RNA polymerase sigma factor (sigma-70 family)